MMVEGDCDLNQALQEFALGLGSDPPDILQGLVGFKELGRIKEDKALVKKTVEIVFGWPIHDSRSGRSSDNGRREESTNIASFSRQVTEIPVRQPS
jgi:hypothetical protein